MLTDKDEFVYHEMIAHIPMIMHSRAVQEILVIGGGDGGTVRELLKHHSVKNITLCEIDGKVVEAAKKYFPAVAGDLNHPKVNVKIDDGIAFVKNSSDDQYDLVIVDSTDPIGPGEGLFSSEFYRNVARILKPDGLMVCQSESPWFPNEALARIARNVTSGFKYMKPYIGSVPTYPRGFWSWTMAAQQPIVPGKYDEGRYEAVAGSLQYLSKGLISGAFALPLFYERKLDSFIK
jgi:spermidine synthase